MRQQFTQIGTLTALLDDSETAPALGTGQPVSVTVESLSSPDTIRAALLSEVA